MFYANGSPTSWWAYGLAQSVASSLPTGVGSTPLPGWVPGNPTYNGQQVTVPQVQAWYDWYLGALVNGEEWEIQSYRSAGYGGLLQLVMPGDGASPSLYSQRIGSALGAADLDGYGTMNTGAVWWKQLEMFGSSLLNTAVDISSVYSGSGAPRGNVCQVGDSSASLANADPWVSGWSDTRWLTYLAGKYGLPVLGENGGNNAVGDLAGIFSLVKGCGLFALQWAWDYQLYDGQHVSLAQYGSAIAAAG